MKKMGGSKRLAGRKAPAGSWITMHGRHVFIPEKGATDDHVFAAGVAHDLSDEAHKELHAQFEKGEIATTAHLHLSLAEALRAKRRGFNDVEAIREGVAHHGVNGVASHAQRFRAAREAEQHTMRAHANRHAIESRNYQREQFHASGKDIKDYVYDHAGSYADAQQLAQHLGYHSTTWDDDRNVTRRRKNGEHRRKVASMAQTIRDRRVMAGKSADLNADYYDLILSELEPVDADLDEDFDGDLDDFELDELEDLDGFDFDLDEDFPME
jgi:hypothetical protein